MERLVRLVTNTSTSTPAATASSTAYWMMGLSTTDSISFGLALVAGRNRVPRPATGNTALRMRGMDMSSPLPYIAGLGCTFWPGAESSTSWNGTVLSQVLQVGHCQ